MSWIWQPASGAAQLLLGAEQAEPGVGSVQGIRSFPLLLTPWYFSFARSGLWQGLTFRSYFSGTSTGQSSASASMLGKVRYTGSSAGQSATSAAMRARMRFDGASAGQSAALATMRVRIGFSGSSAGQSAASASIRARVRYTGSSVGQSACWATLWAVVEAGNFMPGIRSFPLLLTPQFFQFARAPFYPAALLMAKAFGGTSAGQSTTSAEIRARTRFAGSSAGQSTATATIGYPPLTAAPLRWLRSFPLLFRPQVFLFARSSMWQGAGFEIYFAGLSFGQSSASATMRVKAPCSGTSTGQSTAAATMIVRMRFAGASTGQSTTTATIRARVRFETTSSDAQSAAQALMRYRARLDGASAGQSATSATVRYRARLAGTSAGVSTAVGWFWLAGQAREARVLGSPVPFLRWWPQKFAPKSFVYRQWPSVAILLGETYDLSGISTGQSATASTIRARVRYAGGAAGHSTTTAVIRVRVRLTDTTHAYSTASSAVRARVRYIGSSTGQSATMANIHLWAPPISVIIIHLEGNFEHVLNCSGGMGRRVQLEGEFEHEVELMGERR